MGEEPWATTAAGAAVVARSPLAGGLRLLLRLASGPKVRRTSGPAVREYCSCGCSLTKGRRDALFVRRSPALGLGERLARARTVRRSPPRVGIAAGSRGRARPRRGEGARETICLPYPKLGSTPSDSRRLVALSLEQNRPRAKAERRAHRPSAAVRQMRGALGADQQACTT